jgi:hypothetical protein
MIVIGSNNYSYSGRKRNGVKKIKKAPAAFRPIVPVKTYRRDTEYYPSVEATRVVNTPDQSYKKEISATYTIAPAYNKGAYQVIPREGVKDIGR